MLESICPMFYGKVLQKLIERIGLIWYSESTSKGKILMKTKHTRYFDPCFRSVFSEF